MKIDTRLHPEMGLSSDEWEQLYFAVQEYGNGSTDERTYFDGRAAGEESFSPAVLEGFLSNLHSKQRSIVMGEYGEESPEFTDAEWLRLLHEVERKLSFWLETKKASEQGGNG